MIKDTLIREINKLKKQNFSEIDYLSGRKAYLQAISDIFEMLDTLEVKQVDLEKIINDYFKDWKFDEELDIMVKPNNYSATFDDIKEVAKHFFELGLKAQKEE